MGYFFYSINPIYLFYCLMYYAKIKQYTICGDKEMFNRVIKRLNDIYYTQVRNINGKDTPCGFFCSKKYIGFIDIKDNTSISIYTTHSNYTNLIKEDTITLKENENETKENNENNEKETKENNEIITKKINVFIRKGTYKNFYYNPIKLDLSHITPVGQQIDIVNSITDIYNKKGRASIFINGVSGAGKSTVGYLLAKKLNGMYCHTFNPTDPGDQLANVIIDLRQDDEPIIIVIEEVDIIIKNIHKGIIKNTEIPISVHNKSTWCSFMDDMVFYKIIMIFTSNTSRNEIDKMDPSYLRKGRIDEYFNMDTPFNEIK
uniref:ATPase AAA-type core domain-containing protein n=1 Tax=viral metagenome TaxID=1070528 RepID=A0A6C0ETG6_9ZZZZ